MTPLIFGLAIGAALVILIIIGVPVGFALGGLALGLLLWREGIAVLIPAGDALLSSL